MVYICMYQNEVLDYVGIGGWISTLAKVMHLSKFSKLALSKVIGYWTLIIENVINAKKTDTMTVSE
jgi:hypothetical protein